MDLLTELAVKYGTDKWGVHSYTPFYRNLFNRWSVKKLVEIGVFNGASLRMWNDYFPEAKILGIDNNPEHVWNEGRVVTIVADQRDHNTMLAIALDYGPFDVVIDDASHEPEDQAFTANILIPHTQTYIIEDVREGNKERVQEAIKFPTRVVEFNIEKQTDDRLIICER